jgi:hypothetical protein
MMRAHRLLTTGLATLGVLAGGLVFSSAPAFAAFPEAAVTEVPTSFAGTTATLKGELNPVSSTEEVTYHFAYSAGPGATCTESELTAPVEGPFPDAAGNHKKVSEAVEGLEGSTEYTVCLIAANPAEPTESTEGTSVQFTTNPAPPEVIANRESASPVTATDATLNAEINPNNQYTTYTFEYATTEVAIGTPSATPVPEVGPPLTGFYKYQGVSVSTGAVLKAGETYYYRVVAENKTSEEENKPVTGAIQSFTTQGPPVVSTGEALNITQTTATLSGTVNPTGVATTYYFAYISEAGYQAALAKGAPNPYAEGETTAPIGAGSSYEPQTIAPTPISGLQPGQTYHYALIARNVVGVTISPDETLTTPAPTPPTVSTGGVSNVSQNAATLSGTVSTNGLQTSYGFEIGTEAGNYGPATGLGAIGGAQTEEVHVTLGELQPGTTYHYRVAATNQDGASYGAEETFTTPGFPTLITVPSAPPLIATPAIAFPTETGTTTTTVTKALTRAQKLSAALTACRTKSKGKRASCKKRARKRYAPAKAGPQKSTTSSIN